ncbi:MAG: site-specific DNA-methyltransferase [Acidimicrobiaceae bacterium]|nr:site-specific DNA-methyltransferase [Acidimicrobiaceae bacterium]
MCPRDDVSISGQRASTATSSFGVSRREGHDASAFYERFPVPETSRDNHIALPACRDRLWVGDARCMSDEQVADNSVALVVTSPPYFAGKEYEQAVGEGHVPASYKDYLQMLRDVFDVCSRKLESGGRIAVNVANLGRRPYRSLSSDVIGILQDDLGLLLRGEVIWHKAEGASGNCAWGSFELPSNPVLRDLTERIVIASKGRFDRALSSSDRAARELPSRPTTNADEFMDATVDVWEIPAESATRVGHPAPFPVALPERLIDLYTYEQDLVLDPFMGSGTTAVAAVRTGRHYVGFDTDDGYIELARQRIAEERERGLQGTSPRRWESTSANGQSRLLEDLGEDARRTTSATPVSANGTSPSTEEDSQARSVLEGRKAQEKARRVLEECDFRQIRDKVSFSCGVEVNFSAVDRQGQRWLFDVSGAFSVTQRPGLRRTDTLWKALGKAAVLHSRRDRDPLVLLTTDRPVPNSAGDRALQAVTGTDDPVYAVIEMEDPEDLRLLRALASGENLSG